MQAVSKLVANSNLIDHLQTKVEQMCSSHARSEKAANRVRVMRKILESAVSLQGQLHQQRERY